MITTMSSTQLLDQLPYFQEIGMKNMQFLLSLSQY